MHLDWQQNPQALNSILNSFFSAFRIGSFGKYPREKYPMRKVFFHDILKKVCFVWATLYGIFFA